MRLIFARVILPRVVRRTKMSKSEISLRDIRPDYHEKEVGLDDKEILEWNCPYKLFKDWMNLAVEKLSEPNAMTLATASKSGIPSARMVLLKDFSKESGFTFYTNYDGRKARELAENPRAALVLYWAELHRSVRIEGKVSKVAPEISEGYFRQRSKASQAGSAASPQSRIVSNRQWLWDRNDELLKAEEIPMPDWGGYAVEPEWIEFWQGQSNRLHDRVVFSRKGFEGFELDDTSEQNISKLESGWERARLAP